MKKLFLIGAACLATLSSFAAGIIGPETPYIQTLKTSPDQATARAVLGAPSTNTVITPSVPSMGAVKVGSSAVIAPFAPAADFAVQEATATWVPERSRYEAVFSGAPASASGNYGYRSYYAVSLNGTNWTVPQTTPIINTNATPGQWDAGNIGTPSIINLTGTNWVFYWGSPTVTSVLNPSSIGLAYSTDGSNYTKFSGNPVIATANGDNRYSGRVTSQGSTFVMLLNLTTNNANVWSISRATATKLTGPWTMDAGNPVMFGLQDFTNRAEAPSILKLNDSNYWVFVDNLNYLSALAPCKGVETFYTTNIATGTFQYMGRILTKDKQTDWDAGAIFTASPFNATNGQALMLYSGGFFVSGQAIGLAALTPGLSPIPSTNLTWAPTSSGWYRIAESAVELNAEFAVTAYCTNAASSGNPQPAFFKFRASAFSSPVLAGGAPSLIQTHGINSAGWQARTTYSLGNGMCGVDLFVPYPNPGGIFITSDQPILDTPPVSSPTATFPVFVSSTFSFSDEFSVSGPATFGSGITVNGPSSFQGGSVGLIANPALGATNSTSGTYGPILTNGLVLWPNAYTTADSQSTNFIVDFFKGTYHDVYASGPIFLEQTTNRPTTNWVYAATYHIYAGTADRTMKVNSSWHAVNGVAAFTTLTNNTVAVVSIMANGPSETNVTYTYTAGP